MVPADGLPAIPPALTQGIPNFGISPNFREEAPHVTNEEVCRFERSKVPTAIKLRPMHDGMSALCESPDGHVIGEHSDGEHSDPVGAGDGCPGDGQPPNAPNDYAAARCSSLPAG